MAQPHELPYFPPLDRCLSGRERLLSWKQAHRACCHRDIDKFGDSLSSFLASEEAQQTLAAVPKLFGPGRSAASKAAFDTKTASTQISQATNGEYSLDELKADALWLSKELGIDELAALRIAVLEWQQRPAARLISGSDGSSEVAVGLSNSTLGRSVAEVFPPAVNGVDASSGFVSEAQRRDRLLHIFLDEGDAIFSLHADLLTYHDGGAKSSSRLSSSTDAETWRDPIASGLAKRIYKRDFKLYQDYGQNVLIPYLQDQCVETQAQKEQQGFGFETGRLPRYDASKEQRAVDILRVMLSITTTVPQMLRQDFVQAWYTFMDNSTFLQGDVSPTLESDISTLQGMVSLVCLAFLQLPQICSYLDGQANSINRGDVQYPSLPTETDAAYFMDETILSQITLILQGAVSFNVTVAGPAVYAWSLVVANLRALASKAPSSDRDRHQARNSLRSSLKSSSLHPGVWTQRYEAIQLSDFSDGHQDPPRFFADHATNLMQVHAFVSALALNITTVWDASTTAPTAYTSRSLLFELLRYGMSWAEYSEDVLDAILAVLQPGSDLDTTYRQSHHLARQLLTDRNFLRPYILDQALRRYPYELSPFLRILSSIASAGVHRNGTCVELITLLEEQPTMTLMVPLHFRGYRLESEDEGSNEMLLTDQLVIFGDEQHPLSNTLQSSIRALPPPGAHHHHSPVTAVPAGTSGNIIREDPPRVFKLNHAHSALDYLGCLLSTLIPGGSSNRSLPGLEIDRFLGAEIIVLIKTLLAPSMTGGDWIDEAQLVLDHCSASLNHEADIVTVIGEIYRIELLAHLDSNAQEGSLVLLTACTEFLDVLTLMRPERVWAIISRSSLLGLSDGVSAMAAVVAGLEVAVGQFRFLLACVRLYSRLVDDALAGLVKRKNGGSKRTGNRFDSPVETNNIPPERVVKAVLVAYQRVMLDAFQNLSNWKFTMIDEKLAMASALTTTFETLLRATFGLGSSGFTDGTAGGDGIGALLVPAAEVVLRAFIPENGTSLFFDALVGLFLDGVSIANQPMTLSVRAQLLSQTEAVCSFTTTLLRTARAVDPERAIAQANELLRRCVPVFAVLYVVDLSFKSPIALLLTELVKILARDEKEPTSILAPLDREAAIAFLNEVTRLDGPFNDISVEASVWNFLSTVLGGRQQLFSLYLLSNYLPHSQSHDVRRLTTGGATSSGSSLLTFALNQLSNIADLPPSCARAMLKFVKTAQNVWVWATTVVRTHSTFTNNSLRWLGGLKPPARASNSSQSLISAGELEMAALLCDILAVNLLASLETGDTGLLRQVKDHLTFLRDHGVVVNSYNRSMHVNLANNVKARYNDCELSSFVRAFAGHHGDESDDNDHREGSTTGETYDIDMAERILGYEVAWKEVVNSKGRHQAGYRDEIHRANANLRLVHAQSTLLKAWRRLATILAEYASREPSLHATLAKTAEVCLTANLQAEDHIPGAMKLTQERAEMAFLILSKLVNARSTDMCLKRLVLAAWSMVLSSPVDFEILSTTSELAYYRTILQILYLTIQPHVYSTKSDTQGQSSSSSSSSPSQQLLLDPAVATCLVEVVRKTIAPGFRALCGNLHSDIRLASPADFALINALLQAVLSVDGISMVHAQISDVVATSNIVRGALSLFSWADQLANVTGPDPVYGEVAITFLVHLSTVRQVAEHMALSGALVQLSNANLSNYFRKPGGKSPFDEPTRMFAIWTEGFLPLCLNLLDAVGPPVAIEVSAFLNSFPEQLRRSESALKLHSPEARNRQHHGSITLGLVAEAHSLIMVHLILQTDVTRAAAEGLNAADIPALNVDIDTIRELVEGLPRTPRSLVDRVVAVSECEVEWNTTPARGTPHNVLVEKVMQEVHSAMACMAQGGS